MESWFLLYIYLEAKTSFRYDRKNQYHALFQFFSSMFFYFPFFFFFCFLLPKIEKKNVESVFEGEKSIVREGSLYTYCMADCPTCVRNCWRERLHLAARCNEWWQRGCWCTKFHSNSKRVLELAERNTRTTWWAHRICKNNTHIHMKKIKIHIFYKYIYKWRMRKKVSHNLWFTLLQ